MTAAKRITVDDLREKAEGIRDSVREDARRALREDVARTVLVAVVTVAAAVSLAYYLGTRRCRR